MVDHLCFGGILILLRKEYGIEISLVLGILTLPTGLLAVVHSPSTAGRSVTEKPEQPPSRSSKDSRDPIDRAAALGPAIDKPYL